MIIHRDGWKYSGRVPAFWTGQAGCFCCPPPPPPEPGVAYYGRGGSSYNPFPLCSCNNQPKYFPDTMTVTCTSGTCTCLVGQTWTLVRHKNTKTIPELPESKNNKCQFVTSGGSCVSGGPAYPTLFSGLGQCYDSAGGTNLSFINNSCNSGNLSIAIYASGPFCIQFCAGGGVFGNVAKSSPLTLVSCDPFIVTTGTISGIALLSQDICGLGSGVGGTAVFTVTE